jgi:ribosomal protein L5
MHEEVRLQQRHADSALKKITVNMGVGEASRDIKELDAAEKELALITGQKPRTTRAKVSGRTNSRSARACRSAASLPFAASACGNSWTA